MTTRMEEVEREHITGIGMKLEQDNGDINGHILLYRCIKSSKIKKQVNIKNKKREFKGSMEIPHYLIQNVTLKSTALSKHFKGLPEQPKIYMWLEFCFQTPLISTILLAILCLIAVSLLFCVHIS